MGTKNYFNTLTHQLYEIDSKHEIIKDGVKKFDITLVKLNALFLTYYILPSTSLVAPVRASPTWQRPKIRKEDGRIGTERERERERER